MSHKPIFLPLGAAGVFKNVEILRADGSVRFETGEFKNLILDSGIQRLGATSPLGGGNSVASACRVGTDGSAPAVSDLALGNQIASTTTVSSETQGTNLEEGFVWCRRTYTFGLGSVVGNVAELGIGWAASGSGTLFSRALILDQFGNPTTITLLDDEQLRVTWELRCYWPTEDVSGEVENSGNKGGGFGWTARAAKVSDGSIWRGGTSPGSFSIAASPANSGFFYAPSTLGSITGSPSGTSNNVLSGEVSATMLPPDSSSLRYSFPLGRANNANGVQCFLVRFGGEPTSGTRLTGCFQIRFDPPLIKTSLDLLQVDFVLSWGRAS